MSQTALLSRNGSAPKQQEYLQNTVQAFFEDFNWEGVEASKPQATSPVIPDSAEDLFADFGADLDTGLEPNQVQPLSEELVEPVDVKTSKVSVEAFFQAFPWEGHPTIAAPVTPDVSVDILPNLESEEENDLTLDAFSDLF